MLIAHITDLHIGFEPNNPDEPNALRLRQVVTALLALDPAPDAVLITGDLTERGDVVSYVRLKSLLAPLTMPLMLGVGNHDLRAGLREVFPETPVADGFVQYAVDLGDKRLIMLDTRDEEREGGAFCERRGAWLRARLAETPNTPTLLALHHPPVPVGIDWMDPMPRAQWTERLREIVAAAPQVVAVVGGHVHRPLTTRWANTVYVGISSTAPQLALDLRPTDTTPDGRPLIVGDVPAYALHWWSENGLVSHFATADAPPAIIHFDDSTRAMIAALHADSRAS